MGSSLVYQDHMKRCQEEKRKAEAEQEARRKKKSEKLEKKRKKIGSELELAQVNQQNAELALKIAQANLRIAELKEEEERKEILSLPSMTKISKRKYDLLPKDQRIIY